MKRLIISLFLILVILVIAFLLYSFGQEHQLIIEYPFESTDTSESSESFHPSSFTFTDSDFDLDETVTPQENSFDESTEFIRVKVDSKDTQDVTMGSRIAILVKGKTHKIDIEYYRNGAVIQKIKKTFKLDSFYSFLLDMRKLLANDESWIGKFSLDDQPIESIETETIDTSSELIQSDVSPPTE